MAQQMQERFGISDVSQYQYTQDQHTIYAHRVNTDCPVLPYARSYGLPICKKLSHDALIPLHHLAGLYHHQISKSRVELDSEQIHSYLQ